MKKEITQNLKVIILALILVVGVSYVSAAWDPAPSSPPLNNVSAPINVGPSEQWKSGVFGISFATTTGYAFGVTRGLAWFKGIGVDTNGIVSAGKITTNSDLEVGGSIKIHDGGAVIGQTLTAKNGVGDTEWKGTSFGGMFTRNLDANGNYVDCRYANPFTLGPSNDGCTCPSGFYGYRVWEFKNVNGTFYRDNNGTIDTHVGWVDMYQCMAFPSPTENRGMYRWDKQFYP